MILLQRLVFVLLALVAGLALAAEPLVVTGDGLLWDQATRIVTASGPLHIEYQGFIIDAAGGTVDLNTLKGEFLAPVKLVYEEQTVEGQSLTVDFKERSWQVTDAKAVVTPTALEGLTSEPVYLKGASASGTDGEFTLESGSATTCDLEHPHYTLTTSKLRVYPGERIVLEHPKFRILGRTVFLTPSLTIPWELVQQPDYFPTFGSNDVEGYYVSATFPWVLTDASAAALSVDVTEKRGTGLGLEYSIGQPRQSLYTRLYQETGSNTLTARAEHVLLLGDAWESKLTYDFREDSAYAVDTRTNNFDWRLSRSETGNRTSLSFSDRKTDSYSTSEQIRTGLDWDRTLGAGALRTSWLYTDYDSSLYAAANRDLVATLKYNYKGDEYDWSLESNVHEDLDDDDYTGDANYRYVSYRPLLTLGTDSARMPLFKLGSTRWNAQVGFADILEDPYGTRDTRTSFALDAYRSTAQLTGSLKLGYRGSFDQYFYGAGWAQYQVNQAADLEADLGGSWNFTTSYQHRYSAGYSPFSFDSTYPTEQLRGTLKRKTSGSEVSLSTSFDINQNRWYQLRLTGLTDLWSNSSVGVSAAYDIENSVWRPLNLRLTLDEPHIKSYTTFTYDLEKDELSTARADFDFDLAPKWKLGGFIGYSGYTKQFDFVNLRLSRDLHCWTGVVTWDKSRDLVGLYFYINGLPIMQPEFGASQFGGSYYGGSTTFF